MKTAPTFPTLMILLTLAGGLTATAEAQDYRRGRHHDSRDRHSYGRHHGHHHGYQGGTNYVWGYAPAYGYGFGYGYGGTVAGSYLRGYANLVRARGEQNYYNAMAAGYWQQAREQAIVNRTAAVEQYFELREINQQHRQGVLAKSRLSKEQLVELSKKEAPRRLEDDQWDLASDGLAWPAALFAAEFETARLRLDELFRLRRDLSGGLSGSDTLEVQQLCDSMIATLKGQISSVKPGDYAAAKRFVQTLAYEVRFAPGSEERLAAR